MATVFPSIYQAKATQVIDLGRVLKVLVPQVFGEEAIEVTHFLGPATIGMGWVFFQGGNPEFPVWTTRVGPGGGADYGEEIAELQGDVDTAETNINNLYFHQIDQDIEIDDLDGRLDSIEASGAANEVWIGPTAPTDPAIELWYDTDAVAISPSLIQEVHWSPSVTWSAELTAPALGTGGSYTAWYQRIGSWVDLNLFAQFGSPVNGGTGDLAYNLPFPAQYEQVGDSKLWIPSTASDAFGYCRVEPGGSRLLPYFPMSLTQTAYRRWRGADNTAAVGTGIPQVPGQYSVQNNGNISCHIRYKVA